MAEIKVELGVLGTKEIKKKRTPTIVEIDTEKEKLTVHYKTVEYYLDDEGKEVVVTNKTGDYDGNYASWYNTIKTAIEAELAKDVPGTPA